MKETITQRFEELMVGSTDGTSTVFSIASDLVEYGTQIIRDLGCGHREEIVVAAKDTYRKHVRPIDLPGIPNFIEPQVDDQLESIVIILLNKAFDSLCEDDDNPGVNE